MSLHFIIIFLSMHLLTQLNAYLLYPKDSTSLSLTSSVSYPVPEYQPDRTLRFDWCFAMGYNVPGTVSAFYNIPIWPVKGRKREAIDYYATNRTKLFAPYEKYNHKISNTKRHTMDLSAGELYQGIEDYLASFGFHETCLLRSVCELAKHPFDDAHSNVLTEILTLVLTPSLHRGFQKHEKVYREAYESAELQGFLGKNCTMLYPDCKTDVLAGLTKVIFLNN